VCYHLSVGGAACASGCAFPSAYFCRGLLPESLVLEELTKYERPLKGGRPVMDLAGSDAILPLQKNGQGRR